MPPLQGPVIIVGAGPVGLTLALALHVRGIPVVVLEQRPDLPRDLRATTLQPAVLELLDALGVLERLQSRAHRVDRVRWYDGDRPVRIADYGLLIDATTHPYRLHVSQWELCAVLLEHLPPGTVYWDRRAVGFETIDDRVAVTLDDRTRLYGSWLVGSDGVGSTVRTLAGIPVDTGATHAYGSFSAGPSLADHLPHGADCAYFHEGAAWTLVMRMHDSFRVLFGLPEGAPAASVVRGDWRHHLVGPARTAPLPDASGHRAFVLQSRLAHTFRRGRVLLAGDAAHTTFAAGGNALNTGLLDAGLLARALHADEPDLVYAYGRERPRALEAAVLGTGPWTPREGVPWNEAIQPRELLLGISLLAA
ncbi:MAG: FAD-dependent monooxygenase [Myxococcales bacterium]|nr:FAD-dependent monooxygenase [Myxococcales bacterium]